MKPVHLVSMHLPCDTHRVRAIGTSLRQRERVRRVYPPARWLSTALSAGNAAISTWRSTGSGAENLARSARDQPETPSTRAFSAWFIASNPVRVRAEHLPEEGHQHATEGFALHEAHRTGGAGFEHELVRAVEDVRDAETAEPCEPMALVHHLHLGAHGDGASLPVASRSRRGGHRQRLVRRWT